jgi:DNA repair exonuclease SbcCD nuclease subunit
MKTARFLSLELQRLTGAGIPAFIIRGNHDAQSRITRELLLPEDVTLFSGRLNMVETRWNGHDVAVHGVSFQNPHAPDSLLSRYGAPVAGAFNIGLMHTSLGGAAGHDPYAPCSLAELQATGFDYWALGHIHARAEHPGPCTVVMPGIPQGRDIGEAGEKSVSLVTVDDGGAVTVQARALAVAQFERVQVDCTGLSDWADLVAALRAALGAARRQFTAEQLILRPELTGASDLAWRARRDADLLHHEAQAAAEALGTVWIDKLGLALTRPGGFDAGGAVGELAGMIGPDTVATLMGDAQDELARLQKKLPRELRALFGDTEADTAATLNTQMQAGALDLLARLDSGEE